VDILTAAEKVAKVELIAAAEKVAKVELIAAAEELTEEDINLLNKLKYILIIKLIYIYIHEKF
jgi:hypothetical protein